MHIMKIFVTVLLINFSSYSFGSSFNADDIVGYWLSEKGTGVVEVYKNGNDYEGKLVWIKDIHDGKVKDKFDDKNPDEQLKTRSLMGLKMLHGFNFDDQEWKDGKIYDPESGKTYSAFMKLENENKLKLRGYIGISLFGRTSEWTRQKSSTPDKYIQ